MTDRPRVSIVVPCLNRSVYLAPTVESILSQDYPNLECIVVDGGSTDGTLEILRSYGDRIRWVSEPDRGHADAINKGWKMSSGAILAWLNADDVYARTDAVSEAVRCFEADPEAAVIYGDCAVIDEEGRLKSRVVRPRPWDLAYAVKYCDHVIHQAASFIRRSVLENVNWLDVEFAQKKDQDLWLRIGLVGKIQYVPFLFAYLRDCKGISQRGDDVARSCFQLTEKWFTLPGLPAQFRDPGFKRRAVSNSYLRGAIYCFPRNFGGHRRMALKYLLHAFVKDPANIGYIVWEFSRLIFWGNLKKWGRSFLQEFEKNRSY